MAREDGDSSDDESVGRVGRAGRYTFRANSRANQQRGMPFGHRSRPGIRPGAEDLEE